jgi:tRNA-2-methylthio-N6-dimethylallyladenosine synthase
MPAGRVHIVCYGCQMNRLDAELIAQVLAAAGWEVARGPDGADAVLLVTCSVRAHAEDRVFSNIGALAARRRARPRQGEARLRRGEARPDPGGAPPCGETRPDLLIGLLGCMAQQHGRDVFRLAPAVDLVAAPGRLAELPDLLAAARRGERVLALDPPRAAGPPAASDDALDALEARRPAPPTPGRAFVRAMRGCDNFCSYCVVPHVRGPERSRPPHAILEEVRRLVGQGAGQVTLLGQAVNQYAAEEAGRRWDLADLLAAVAGVPGLSRLRFITNHPRAMTPRLAGLFRDVPNVCPHLHMPAQAGSDAVLGRMDRGYTAAEYLERAAMVRAARPDVGLYSDFIVGFPGETTEAFEATLDLVRRLRTAGAFVFRYSPRPGTRAAGFPDDVPDAEKRRRHRELLALVGEIAEQQNRAFIGRTVEVLVEDLSPRQRQARGLRHEACATARPEDHPSRTPAPDRRPDASSLPLPPSCLKPPASSLQLRGRTPCHRLVVFDGPRDLVGRTVPVRVEGATSLTLLAHL